MDKIVALGGLAWTLDHIGYLCHKLRYSFSSFFPFLSFSFRCSFYSLYVYNVIFIYN